MTQDGGGSANSLLEELVALERSALDRWIQPDPQGYFEVQAAEITYFDPFTDKRVNGREALHGRLAPMKSLKVPFTDPRYEIIEPKVQRHGDVALLTFNLVNYGKLPDRPESMLARWNATEVYERIDGRWTIIHTHWSFVQAQPTPPGAYVSPSKDLGPVTGPPFPPHVGCSSVATTARRFAKNTVEVRRPSPHALGKSIFPTVADPMVIPVALVLLLAVVAAGGLVPAVRGTDSRDGAWSRQEAAASCRR